MRVLLFGILHMALVVLVCVLALLFAFLLAIAFILVFYYYASKRVIYGKRPEWCCEKLAAWIVRDEERALQEYCDAVAKKLGFKTKFTVYVVLLHRGILTPIIADGTSAIYVPRHYVAFFSQDEWKCIFAHEIGHFVLNQCMPPKRNRDFFKELGCDLVSVIVMGKALTIQVLQKLSSPEASDYEIQKRIEYIKRIVPDDQGAICV